MELERRDYPDLPPPAGAFHHSVRWGNLLFIAGSTARGTDAEQGDIAAQTENILERFQHILSNNGATLDNSRFRRVRGQGRADIRQQILPRLDA